MNKTIKWKYEVFEVDERSSDNDCCKECIGEGQIQIDVPKTYCYPPPPKDLNYGEDFMCWEAESQYNGIEAILCPSCKGSGKNECSND